MRQKTTLIMLTILSSRDKIPPMTWMGELKLKIVIERITDKIKNTIKEAFGVDSLSENAYEEIYIKSLIISSITGEDLELVMARRALEFAETKVTSIEDLERKK